MTARFDELESMAIPPSLNGQRRGRSNPIDPSNDTFRERFAPFSSDPAGDYLEKYLREEKFMRGKAPWNNGRERYGDPSKVIAEMRSEKDIRGTYPGGFIPDVEVDNLKEDWTPENMQKHLPGVDPDSWGTIIKNKEGGSGIQFNKQPDPGAQISDASPDPVRPGQQFAQASFPLPQGVTRVETPKDFPLPEGVTRVEPEGSKAERFLKNLTPEGPISGVIALARTAGEAAKGQRPDLLTNPEGAIPEAVQGAIAQTGARPFNQVRNAGNVFDAARAIPKTPPQPAPKAPPAPEPLQLTFQPENSGPTRLEAARLNAKRVAQDMRDSGRMPPESSDADIALPGPVTPPAPPSPLLPAQLVREFGAVRKGVELSSKLNPESAANLSAREQALSAATRPHLTAIGKRSAASIDALEGALPEEVLTGALKDPGKAASVSNWLQVYERAARAKFSVQAKSSLDLATRNLNNNLGTDLTLGDILKGL